MLKFKYTMYVSRHQSRGGGVEIAQVQVEDRVAQARLQFPTDPSLPEVLLPAAPSILSGAGSDFEFRQKYSTVSL